MARHGEIRRTPAELFNGAAESYRRGKLAESVALLRSGFFENLYIAPLLLEEEFRPQSIWHPGPLARVESAREYVSRYGRLWRENPEELSFLRKVWNDPLVRNELKSYINLCKSFGNVRGNRQRSDLLRERERFSNPERIIRTQSEILQRITGSSAEVKTERPLLGLVMLSSLDTAASVEFYRSLFGIEPTRTSHITGGYAEFEFQGVHIAIHGYNQHGAGDPYRLGPPPESLGWGAFFVIRVGDFDRYYGNAVKAEIEILDCNLQPRGGRFFVVKDPSGYVLEITEEELRGLDET